MGPTAGATSEESRSSLRERLRQPVRAPSVDPLLTVAVLAAVAIRIVFWAYTDRVWEDALITVTHARNAADGLGLVHHAGEGRVQGFTSALSVLIPLAGEALRAGSGLAVIKLVSLAATVVTVVYAYRLTVLLELRRSAAAFVLAFVALDYQQILFGMSGMETQIAVAILLGGFVYVIQARPVAAGVMFGLALLVRPDFLLWVVPGLVWFAVRASRRAVSRALAATAAVAMPWYLFATVYYGSPISETIRAKAAGFAMMPALSDGLGAWLTYLWEQPSRQTHLWKNLAPFIESWPAYKVPLPWWLSNIAFVMLVLAIAGAWRTRNTRGWRPALVFVGLFTGYLLFGGRVDFFSWYLPPFMAAVALLAGAGLTALGDVLPRVATGLAAALALAFAAALPFDFRLERTVQHDIENQVRLPLGNYLNRVVAPGQAVTSESSGYVGYYGRVKLLDYPGLTSPAALRTVRSIPRDQRDYPALAIRLQPEWIVARPFEVAAMLDRDPRIRDRYVQSARFAVPESRSRLKAGPVQWRNIDRDFVVLRRVDAQPRGR